MRVFWVPERKLWYFLGAAARYVEPVFSNFPCDFFEKLKSQFPTHTTLLNIRQCTRVMRNFYFFPATHGNANNVSVQVS